MTHICVCKYPIMVIDKRDGQEIEYLAMPLQVIENGEIPVPDIDVQNAEGLDGIVRDYVVVRWQDVTPNMHAKKYDVVGHVVIAGCELSEASKGEDGNLQCDSKSIYTVFHPLEEWKEKHIIEIPPMKR
jgi:hypothetical protein